MLFNFNGGRKPSNVGFCTDFVVQVIFKALPCEDPGLPVALEILRIAQNIKIATVMSNDVYMVAGHVGNKLKDNSTMATVPAPKIEQR